MSWSAAFARQSCSDFEAREAILEHALPRCHELHYLQMAMEKAAKAHLIDMGTEPLTIQSSHAYIAKVIPIIVMDGLGRAGGKKDGWIMERVRELADRINRLHPQIDAAASPANCEYPWPDAKGNIIAPADHDFSSTPSHDKVAITMIKEVRRRVTDLAASPE